MSRGLFCACLAFLAGLTSCVDRTPPSNGQVFAGPADLPLHEEPNPKSKVVGLAHHGQKLDIVQQHRRLFKLRTPAGVTGWTDERNLMNTDQMHDLGQLEDRARRLPSQGVGTTYELLNVHTLPQRYSPSFFQIREGEKFDVLAHQTAPRAEPVHHALVKPQPRSESKKSSRGARKLLQINPPPPPKPPDDWVELSEQRKPPPDVNPHPAPAELVPEDDWTLVRTSRGAAGWVLTSRIYLNIPDEVAQYAEGHRITTYFSIGKVHDDDLNEGRGGDKNIWLWTTVSSGDQSYDFDSFRVFTWSLRHHRYETAYIQRRVEGYLPVLVDKSAGGATFSVCLANDDGQRVRMQYALVGVQVKGAGSQPCAAEASEPQASKAAAAPAGDKPTAPKSLWDRFKEWKGRLVRKEASPDTRQ
jgi:hypothetical protein